MQSPSAQRRPGRPRGSSHGQTRASLVEAATAEFASGGFRGSALTRVAAAAGLTPAGLLHHFGSKEALLAEVLRQRDEADRAAFPLASDVSPGFQVLHDLLDLIRHNAANLGLVRLFSTMSGEAVDPEHPARGWLEEHFTTIGEPIRAALRAGIRNGTVRHDAPVEAIAHIVIAVMDGLQVQWLLDPDGLDMVAIADEAFQALRNRWEIPADAT